MLFTVFGYGICGIDPTLTLSVYGKRLSEFLCSLYVL